MIVLTQQDGYRFARIPLSAHQQLEQRLLSVQAILRLVPYHGALAVEQPLGDLLARVRGQAVEGYGVVAGLGEQPSSRR